MSSPSQQSQESDEGEGDVIRPFSGGKDDDMNDSSEEEEEDEEEARKLREGFIVDDDEDGDGDENMEGEGDGERRRRKKKRGLKKRKRESASPDLEADDFDLIAENTGLLPPSSHAASGPSLKRFRRRSSSPPTSPQQNLPDLASMFDNPGLVPGQTNRLLRGEDGEDGEEDEEEMDDFIVDEEEDGEEGGEGGREERERRKEERRKERRRAKENGMGEDVQNEIHDIFGDGEDYRDALGDDDQDERPAEGAASMMDVFEPSEIAERYLTDQDHDIRGLDVPERHQLSTSTLSSNPAQYDTTPFPSSELAAQWVAPRVSTRVTQTFYEQGDGYTVFRGDLKREYEQAVEAALDGLFVRNMEVPYLWHNERDSFIERTAQVRGYTTYLEETELWAVYDLGIKYKAITTRREALEATYNRMKEIDATFQDEYFEEWVLGLSGGGNGTAEESVESVAEAMEYLEFKCGTLVKAAKEMEAAPTDRKRAGRVGELAAFGRDGHLRGLLERFGVDPSQAVVNMISGSRANRSAQYASPPIDAADEFVNAEEGWFTREDVLQAASKILVNEFGKDPLLRSYMRQKFKSLGTVTVRPTERGKVKIDELHQFYTFKYLKEKPLSTFGNQPQFAQMLAAEADGLITIHIEIPQEVVGRVIEDLFDGWRGLVGSNPETSKAWNDLRKEIVEEAVLYHQLPAAAAATKEEMREKDEALIGKECENELKKRVNVTPLQATKMEKGDSPAVIAITCGRGNRDAVMAVFVNNQGHILQQTKIDALEEPGKAALLEMIFARKPNAIVIGGFTVQTTKVRQAVLDVVKDHLIKDYARTGRPHPQRLDENGNETEQFLEWAFRNMIQVLYIQDAVARIYMNSERAKLDNPTWPANSRYALGLARYAQDPLNEYCALGRDITAISFSPSQSYMPQERLLRHLERALVTIVNAVGLDINQAARDPYVRKVLPFIAGLGPRKAEKLVKDLSQLDGALVNRVKLIESDLLRVCVWSNMASFVYIPQDVELEESDIGPRGDTNGPDPLDNTRIHPKDYELAQEICENLMDIDPEDAQQQNPSKAVVQLQAHDNADRLIQQISFEEFNAQIYSRNNQPRGFVVQTIMRELTHGYEDTRPMFLVPSDWDVVTMLTGETSTTIGPGYIVTAHVTGTRRDMAFVRLESEIVGTIEMARMSDDGQGPVSQYAVKGQTVRGVVYSINLNDLEVSLAINPANMIRAKEVGLVAPDPFFDHDAELKDKDEAARKRRKDLGTMARIIKHPRWQLFNRQQAEAYLASQNRGDAVIRPSSLGPDHLAVTWKVDEGIYQHIDVEERDKPSALALGRILRVEGLGSYSDLDELLVSHVAALANKVDKLTEHEKYKPEEELDQYLKTFVMAHAGKSAYGFSLDSKKPGWAKLSFLSKSPNTGGVIQTWPVRILPGAYKLWDAEVPGMQQLCDAFKAQYRSRLEEQKAGGGMIGRTPRAGATPSGRTPAAYAGGRTPGGMTPGGIYGGATPGGYPNSGSRPPTYGVTPLQGAMRYKPPPTAANPYASTPSGANPYAGTPVASSGGSYRPPPHVNYGYPPSGAPPPPPPSHPAPPMPPASAPPARAVYMNPERAAFLNQQSNGRY